MPQSSELTLCDKRGTEFRMYLNLNNDCTTPVWTLHKGLVGDLTINEVDDENELDLRDPNLKTKQYVSGRTDVEISGQQVVDQLYEGCAFLNSARAGGQAVDIVVLTGDLTTEGEMGWRGRFRNFDRGLSGPNQGSATQNFRLKPAACQPSNCQVRPVMVVNTGTNVELQDYNPETFTP